MVPQARPCIINELSESVKFSSVELAVVMKMPIPIPGRNEIKFSSNRLFV
jgi:hypothetical protein